MKEQLKIFSKAKDRYKSSEYLGSFVKVKNQKDIGKTAFSIEQQLKCNTHAANNILLFTYSYLNMIQGGSVLDVLGAYLYFSEEEFLKENLDLERYLNQLCENGIDNLIKSIQTGSGEITYCHHGIQMKQGAHSVILKLQSSSYGKSILSILNSGDGLVALESDSKGKYPLTHSFLGDNEKIIELLNELRTKDFDKSREIYEHFSELEVCSVVKELNKPQKVNNCFEKVITKALLMDIFDSNLQRQLYLKPMVANLIKLFSGIDTGLSKNITKLLRVKESKMNTKIELLRSSSPSDTSDTEVGAISSSPSDTSDTEVGAISSSPSDTSEDPEAGKMSPLSPDTSGTEADKRSSSPSDTSGTEADKRSPSPSDTSGKFAQRYKRDGRPDTNTREYKRQATYSKFLPSLSPRELASVPPPKVTFLHP
jgi:hypothetical protein